MKRLLTMALALAMALSVTSCARRAGDNDAEQTVSDRAVPQAQTISEEESIERKLIKTVSDNYAGTKVDQIQVTKKEEGDYAVQALLTWSSENDAEQTRRSLTGYSEDFANRVSKDTANVSDLTVSWTVPAVDPDRASVVYSYERKNGALQETGHDISDRLGGEDAVSGDQETADGSVPAGDAAEEQDQEEALAAILAAMEEKLKDSYGPNYTLTHDDSAVQIGVWRDGVADAAVYAHNGDESYLSRWRTLVSTIQSLSSTLSDTLNTAGIENRQVILSVVNDQNRDNVLLTVTDGQVTYNWVEPDTVQAG